MKPEQKQQQKREEIIIKLKLNGNELYYCNEHFNANYYDTETNENTQTHINLNETEIKINY